MKSFITKILILIGVLFVINNLVDNLLPSHYGNEVISEKYDKMLLDSDVNTVFLGTSRIHCHVNPNQFDRLTGQSNSFNLGSPGSTGLETTRIIDHLINNADNHQINTIYVEVPAFSVPPLKNVTSARGIYFLDGTGFIKAMRYTANSVSTKLMVMQDLLRGTRLVFSNAIGINLWKRKINLVYHLITHSQEKIKVAKNKGFSPIKGVNKDIQGLKTRQQQARKFYNESINQESTEITFLTKFMKAKIDEAIEAGIRIVYVIMPKNPIHQYQNKYWSLESLPKKHKLNLSIPKEYPKFYQNKLSSDKAHLNVEGAKIMTELLSNHYNKYLKH